VFVRKGQGLSEGALSGGGGVCPDSGGALSGEVCPGALSGGAGVCPEGFCPGAEL